jgi:enoyl-CoA hydratase
MSNAIVLEDRGKIKVIRFNRPEIRSPLSRFVLDELHRLLDEIAQDPGTRAVIFTGERDVFASGADIREIEQLTSETAPDFARLGQGLMRKIETCGKITVAAINGFCFGGALDLALSCSKRIASPGATFSHPGVTLGIITGWGGTQRLPRLVGEARALEMFLTAKRVTASEALEIGLVDEISERPLKSSIEWVKRMGNFGIDDS